MPYASFAAACRTPWRPFASLILYSDPKSACPDLMLKISAREFIPTPDCVAVTEENEKGGKAMGTIYGLIRYFDSRRFWAPLGATAILATATVAWGVTPTLVFELDGNVADDPGNTIADWN